jgi:hypothetical protein
VRSRQTERVSQQRQVGLQLWLQEVHAFRQCVFGWQVWQCRSSLLSREA